MPEPELQSDESVTTTEVDADGTTESQTTDIKFYNQHDGTKGRMPGQYLDRIEQEQAEILRAEAEGREPDLEHPSSTAGTPIVTEDQLPDNAIQQQHVYTGEDTVEPATSVSPVAELPVDQTHADVGPTFGGSVPTEQDAANAELGNVAGDPVTGGSPSNGTLSGVQHKELADNPENANPDYSADPANTEAEIDPDIAAALASTEVPSTITSDVSPTPTVPVGTVTDDSGII